MSIPKALDSNSSIVLVKVDKCCDWQNYSYTDKGWHYLCATIKEFINNPNINYKDSLLSKYYRSYHPKFIQDCLFYEDDEWLHPISNGSLVFPWGNKLIFEPNNQHFGPNSDTFVEKEIYRTICIYKKIASEGYQPEKYRDGYIRGHFLKNHDDYRFMLAGGQHRMAVLGVLGYKTIKVMIQPTWERVIDIENVQLWPQVHNGNYDEETAIKIFNSYFRNNGREKAEMLNLID